MEGLRSPEARETEARRMVREGRLGQQEMEENGNEWERRDGVGV